MTEKRFVAIDDDEVYYITDTKGLKTLEDYIKEFSKPEYEFTEDEVLEHAKEEYWQLIYEASMTATENVNWLNNLYEENKKFKKDIADLEMNKMNIERILQEEYAESNIPVWKHEYLKDIAYKMGMSLKNEYI